MEQNQPLNNFKVGSVPTVIYIPDFITDDEETMLLNNIYKSPVSKWKSLKNRRLQNWGGVVHEKGLVPQELPSWLTNITGKIYDESGLFPSPINHVLINEYLPNQGIMAHQDGPAYHPVVAILSLGSPVVMNFTPHSRLTSCTGANTNNAADTNSHRGIFKTDTDDSLYELNPFTVILMPHSLLIFKDTAYSDYLHAINDSEVHCYDKAVNELQALPQQVVDHPSSEWDETPNFKCIHRNATRISLTCRLVLKVHKNLFRL